MEGIPIQKTDTLRISAWATFSVVVLNVVLDIRRPNGEHLRTTYTFSPTSDMSETVFSLPLPEGELQSCVVYIQNQYVLRGQCFVRAVIHQGTVWQGQPHVVLFADYVTTAAPLSFPGSPVRSSVDGTGYTYVVAYTLDSSYTLFDVKVPAGYVWRPNTVQCDVVISAEVGDRILRVSIMDSGDNVFFLATPRVPFSSAGTYSVSISAVPGTEFAVATIHNVPIPVDLRMYPYWYIRLEIEGAQAGDYIANANFSVEEWIYI